MKKHLRLFSLVLFMGVTFGQTKPKQNSGEKPSAQKETDAAMKEIQKAMEGMSPEEKKMMENMGVKPPSMKGLPKASDKQMKDAIEKEEKVIPSKKTELIAHLPKKIFSIAELNTYLKPANASVADIITPKSKELAEKVMAGASISADNRVGVNSGYSGKSGREFSGLRVK
jgi:hypothetical protein